MGTLCYEPAAKTGTIPIAGHIRNHAFTEPGVSDKAEKGRLDGYQARCLRIIQHLPPAFLTRVPNSKVPEQAGQKQCSAQLLQRQIPLVGKVGRAPDADSLRQLAFQPGA
eukprot:1129634-Pyramimonas_sp.AAC.1